METYHWNRYFIKIEPTSGTFDDDYSVRQDKLYAIHHDIAQFFGAPEEVYETTRWAVVRVMPRSEESVGRGSYKTDKEALDAMRAHLRRQGYRTVVFNLEQLIDGIVASDIEGTDYRRLAVQDEDD